MKLTDAEIVEKVTKGLNRSKCLEPFDSLEVIEQKDIEIAELHEEINRQKVKIEDMQKVIQSVMAANVRLINEVGKAKDEAFKEFAERLKEKYRFYGAIGKLELYEGIDSLAHKRNDRTNNF